MRWFAGPGGRPAIDWTGRAGRFDGRGVWTHPSERCVQQAMKRGAFRRAWSELDPSATVHALCADAVRTGESVWRRRLGLANRARAAAVGQQAVRESMASVRTGVLLLARDASESTKERFRANALRKSMPVIEVTAGAWLGQALGREFVSVVHVEEGAFSEYLRSLSASLAALGSTELSQVEWPRAEKPSKAAGAVDQTDREESTFVGTQDAAPDASQERACRSV